MGFVKRGSMWWMSFMFQGQQVRRSTGTLDRRLTERGLRFFGQNLSCHKWCLAVSASTAVGCAGLFSQYTRSGVRPSSARCGLI